MSESSSDKEGKTTISWEAVAVGCVLVLGFFIIHEQVTINNPECQFGIVLNGTSGYESESMNYSGPCKNMEYIIENWRVV